MVDRHAVPTDRHLSCGLALPVTREPEPDETCPTCGGTGVERWNGYAEKCSECGGMSA